MEKSIRQHKVNKTNPNKYINRINPIAKSYFGDNLHTLTRDETKYALEKLSDCLHVDINTAKITRLDVSTTLQTKRPPANYFRYLGEKPYFKRLEAVKDETLYYCNHQRQIILYDKTKEAISNNVPIPDILRNSNLLRYELRYIKRLNKQLNIDLAATKLYNEDFYRSVIQNWYNEFMESLKERK